MPKFYPFNLNLERFTKKSMNKQGQGQDSKIFSRGTKHGGTFAGLMYAAFLITAVQWSMTVVKVSVTVEKYC